MKKADYDYELLLHNILLNKVVHFASIIKMMKLLLQKKTKNGLYNKIKCSRIDNGYNISVGGVDQLKSTYCINQNICERFFRILLE